MSATNATPTISLPLFIGTDKPAWLTDWNGAMNTIDGAIATLQTAEGGTATALASLSQSVEALSGTVSQHTTSLQTITTAVAGNTGSINTINSLIGNGQPTTEDKTIIGAINEIYAEIGGGDGVDADEVNYDNTDSGLTATDVQAAIDELKNDIDDIVIPTGTTVLAEVTADGVKTVAQLFADLWNLIPSDTPYDTMVKTVLISHTGATKAFSGYTAGTNVQYRSFYVDAANNVFHAESQIIRATNSYYAQCTGNTSGITFDNAETSAVPTSGQKIQILIVN